MIPPTKHGLPALVVLSAMQKYIRRGLEREAMECAVELIHTSRAFATMVANRLEIISHEDIDTGESPHVVPFVRACAEQARALWTPEKAENPGAVRMVVGNAIRMMCRAPKSREGDHFQAAVGLRALLEDFAPELPDFAFDKHTPKGKAMGRGIDHFLTEGCKLERGMLGIAQTQAAEQYEREAHRLWRLKEKLAEESKPKGKRRSQLGLPGAE